METKRTRPANPATIGKEEAEKNLQRHLDWIARYDVRSSLVVGIAIGMLGGATGVAPLLSKWTLWLGAAFTSASLLLVGVLISIWVGQFPRTRSPNNSLLFFGTVAALKLDEYIRRFSSISERDYVEDLIAQAHVNAGIVLKKFRALKIALILLLLSIIPWSMSIYLSKLTQ